MGHFVSGAEGKTAVFLEIWRKQRPEMHLSGSTMKVERSRLALSEVNDFSHFS